MKVVRIILAAIITLAMLYVAHSNSRGQPEQIAHSDGAYTFEMTTVPKVTENQSGQVTVHVSGPLEGKRVMFRTSQPDNLTTDRMHDFAAVEMLPTPDRPGQFYVDVTAGDRGGRFHYFIEIVDAEGVRRAGFAAENGAPFFLRYIGDVPKPVLLGHIFFIFATVFCIGLATVHAIGVIRGGDGLGPMARCLFWAAVFCFIGGYPLGWPMNYYAFNGLWEGVPFGTDATDNKTQLLFVYLLFASLTTLGSFSQGRFGRDLFAPRTLGWIGMGAFGVMLFIYLIPHSIQFSARFTYVFCYTWTAVVAALYVLGLLRSRTTRA
jgi:hypothetical protein